VRVRSVKEREERVQRGRQCSARRPPFTARVRERVRGAICAHAAAAANIRYRAAAGSSRAQNTCRWQRRRCKVKEQHMRACATPPAIDASGVDASHRLPNTRAAQCAIKAPIFMLRCKAAAPLCARQKRLRRAMRAQRLHFRQQRRMARAEQGARVIVFSSAFMRRRGAPAPFDCRTPALRGSHRSVLHSRHAAAKVLLICFPLSPPRSAMRDGAYDARIYRLQIVFFFPRKPRRDDRQRQKGRDAERCAMAAPRRHRLPPT